jgi:hypothetical protein
MINVLFWHTLLSGVAIAAGYRIALRAWRKLRRQQVSIELLVTVAITGALLMEATRFGRLPCAEPARPANGPRSGGGVCRSCRGGRQPRVDA